MCCRVNFSIIIITISLLAVFLVVLVKVVFEYYTRELPKKALSRYKNVVCRSYKYLDISTTSLQDINSIPRNSEEYLMKVCGLGVYFKKNFKIWNLLNILLGLALAILGIVFYILKDYSAVYSFGSFVSIPLILIGVVIFIRAYSIKITFKMRLERYQDQRMLEVEQLVNQYKDFNKRDSLEIVCRDFLESGANALKENCWTYLQSVTAKDKSKGLRDLSKMVNDPAFSEFIDFLNIESSVNKEDLSTELGKITESVSKEIDKRRKVLLQKTVKVLMNAIPQGAIIVLLCLMASILIDI